MAASPIELAPRATGGEIIKGRNAAASLLGVRCGTGRHLAAFAALGFRCAGVDVSSEMLAKAKDRVGGVATKELAVAVARLAGHLGEHGVLLLEPWFAPHQWLAPMVTAESAKVDDIAVARVSRAVQEGGLGVFEWLCSVATPERTWSFTEVHELGLYEIEEYLAACRSAGLLQAEHLPLAVGRGLGVIVAQRLGTRAGG